MGRLDTLEGQAVDTLAKIGPWAGPLPTAYSIGRAGLVHFGWPWPVALALAVAVEVLGIASVSTALMLRGYNLARRKADPAAPFGLAVVLVAAYLVTATVLVVLVDVVPGLVRYAPALLPLLSLGAAVVLGLRADHAHRLKAIDDDKAERRVARQVHRIGAQGAAQDGRTSAQVGVLGAVNQARQARRAAQLDALLVAYQGNPQLGTTEAARLIGVHRNTIYNYLEELERLGRIARNNGDGVKVLEG